jgi:hypothetical protein
MTTDEFNALPLEARHFIETHSGCLSCGNPSAKLTRAYELYKSYKMAHAYVLFGGGINFAVEGKGGVLYNVAESDTPFEVREKLALAERIYAKSPEAFITFDQKAIDELRAALPEDEVVDLDPEGEVVDLDPEGEEDPAALELWARRSEALGIDTKTADYPALQAFAKEKGLNATGKKVEIIAAIDAIDVELL